MYPEPSSANFVFPCLFKQTARVRYRFPCRLFAKCSIIFSSTRTIRHSAVVLRFFLQGPLHHLPFAWIPSLCPKVLPLPPSSLHQVTFNYPCTSNKEDGLIANANAERRLPEPACPLSSPLSCCTPSPRSTRTRTSWRTRISSLS